MVIGLCEIIVVRIQSLDEEQMTPLVFKEKKRGGGDAMLCWCKSL